MTNNQAGKGDKYRPVDQKKWDENWKKIFVKTNRPKKKVIKKPRKG